MANRYGEQNNEGTGRGSERNFSQSSKNIRQGPGMFDARNERRQQEQGNLQSVAGLVCLQNALLAAREGVFPISKSSQHTQPSILGVKPEDAEAKWSCVVPPNLASVSTGGAMEQRGGRQAEYLSYLAQSQFRVPSRENQETSIEDNQRQQNARSNSTTSRPGASVRPEQAGKHFTANPTLQLGSGVQHTNSLIQLAGLRHIISNTNDNTEEEMRKRFHNGATLVPCRARGMPRDHAKNACLIVPNNVKHGEGLLCSHMHCQNKGIRFVYCEVCKHPVAKYNFTTRHKHLEVFQPSAVGRSTGVSKRTQKGTREGIKNKDKKAIYPRIPFKDTRKRSQEESQEDDRLENKTSKFQKRIGGNTRWSRSTDGMTGSRMNSRRHHDNQNAGDGGSPAVAVGNPSQQARLILGSSETGSFTSCADSLDVLGEGLFDKSKPNRTVSSSGSFLQGDNIQEKKWLLLLKERPASRDIEKMNTWLESIIRTSEHVVTLRPPVTNAHTNGQKEGGDQSSDEEGSSVSTTEENANSNSAVSTLIANGIAFAIRIENEPSFISFTTGGKTEDEDGRDSFNNSRNDELNG